MEHRAQGLFVAQCLITRTGDVTDCRVIEPVRYMERAVLDALASRKYEPAKQNGVPIDVRYTFNIRLVPPVDPPTNPPGKVQP